MARTAKKRLVINFKGVDSFVVVPEDDYEVKIAGMKYGTADSGYDKIDWKLEIVTGKHKGNSLRYTSSLQEQALWRLRQFLQTAGIEVPDGEMELTEEDCLDATLTVKVETEDYEGRPTNRVVGFIASGSKAKAKRPAADDDEAEDDEPKRGRGRPRKAVEDDEADEAPKRGRGRPPKAKAEPEDDEDEAPRRGRGRPAKARDDEDEDEAPKRRRAARDEAEDEDDEPKRPARRRARDEDDEDERPAKATKRRARDDEDDEDEAPRKAKPAKKGKAKVSADDVEDMDEDALEETIEAHALDVDLSEFKSLRKKQSAVIDALETAGVLAE